MSRMGGKIATDATSACETCLYDLKSGEWESEISIATRIQASILPEILPSGRVIGEIGEGASAKTGLSEGTLLVMGGADTECGVLGLGACELGDTAVITGSSAPIESIVDSPIVDAQYRTLTNPFLIDGKWVVESNPCILAHRTAGGLHLRPPRPRTIHA